jgi:thioredoxin-related protein
MSIIRHSACLLLWLSCCPASAIDYTSEYEEEHTQTKLIKQLTSLKDEATLAREKNIPILVEFSSPWCSYCEALEEKIFEPLITSKDFKDKIIIKKLEVNDYSDITGFDGKVYLSEEISRKYKVKLYPTLVFFNAEGKEISERIIGITVIEYVTEQIENSITTAVNTTRKKLQ